MVGDARELILDSGCSMLDSDYQILRIEYPASSIQHPDANHLKPYLFLTPDPPPAEHPTPFRIRTRSRK